MSLRNNTLTAYRMSGGDWVDGYWVDGTEEALPAVKASIQPFNPEEIDFIPANRRGSDRLNIFTGSLLFCLLDNDDDQPDQIDHDGSRWEVIKKFVWQNNIINHYRYIIIRLVNK